MLRGSQPVGADHGGGVPVTAGVASPPPADTHHDHAANPTTTAGQPTPPDPTATPGQPTTSDPTATSGAAATSSAATASGQAAATAGTATHGRATVIDPAAGAATTATLENGVDQPTLTTRRESSRTPELDDYHDQAPAHRGRPHDAGTIRVEPQRHGGETPLGPDRAAPGDRGRRGRHTSSPPPLTETGASRNVGWVMARFACRTRGAPAREGRFPATGRCHEGALQDAERHEGALEDIAHCRESSPRGGGRCAPAPRSGLRPPRLLDIANCWVNIVR